MTVKGQQHVHHILRKAPTVTLRGMRGEIAYAPEWRDVGKQAEQIIKEREVETSDELLGLPRK